DGTTLNFVPGIQPPSTTGLGGVRAQAASASFFLTGVDNTGGVTRTQVGFSNLSGTATVAQGGTGGTTAAAAATNLSVLPLSGGTMTGALITADPLTVDDPRAVAVGIGASLRLRGKNSSSTTV